MGNDDDTDNPIQACPGPCDAVIPIVYYNQPITIMYSAIRDNMAWYERAAIDEEASVKRTFTQPNTHPPLRISQASETYVKVLGLGHAGVAFINGKTGEVAYYEYGRYTPGGSYGWVREAPNMSGVTVSFGDDNNPTPATFNSMLKKLASTNGGPYAYWSTYTKLANGAYDIMKNFAERRKREVNSLKSAAAYDINSNHCFTFALEVAAQAGVNADVSAAPDLQVILVSITGGTVDSPESLAVELPSRQMLELQKRYRPLNVASAGSVEGSFTFPEGLNSK